MKYIDIHTHNFRSEEGIISINNLFPEEEVPTWSSGTYYSVGLHPWLLESSLNLTEQLFQVEKKAVCSNVLAIGECGLDKLARVDMALQEKVFSLHIMIAEKLNKPLIVHCVKTCNELIQLRKKFDASTPWILHGFKGSPETARQLQNNGFMFSFGKALVNPKLKVIQSFLQIPVELIFFETDESELGISDLYTIASGIRNCTVEDLQNQIQLNFNRIFLAG